jgi:hypothetical protein
LSTVELFWSLDNEFGVEKGRMKDGDADDDE